MNLETRLREAPLALGLGFNLLARPLECGSCIVGQII